MTSAEPFLSLRLLIADFTRYVIAQCARGCAELVRRAEAPKIAVDQIVFSQTPGAGR